jgi:mannose-1-phosphate guanylyltransferase
VQDVKAMIMAAGYGERMRPLSDRRPKPLLPVLGRPLINYVIEQLVAGSVNRIGINTHHLAEQVRAHLENGFSGIRETVSSYEEIIRGTGGGMRGLRDFLAGEEPFLVHNGDVLSTVVLPDVIEFHRQRSPLVTMVLVDYPPVNTVTVSSEGFVTDFCARLRNRRLSPDQDLTFTGISVVDPIILDLIPDTISYNIIDLYLNLIESKPDSICGYVPEDAYWIDVGTPAAYLQLHRDILIHGKVPLPDANVPSRGTYQGPDSRIESGAHLEGFISLGRNCHIAKNVHLENCVVWDNSVVLPGTRCNNGVIDGNWIYRFTGE